MRYRALTVDGDMTFGRSQGNFLINTPDAVAQAILTRLRLIAGQWWLDLSEGTPYYEQILGKHNQASADVAFRQRILATPNVLRLSSYSSSIGTDRKITVRGTVDTAFGQVNLEHVL